MKYQIYNSCIENLISSLNVIKSKYIKISNKSTLNLYPKNNKNYFSCAYMYADIGAEILINVELLKKYIKKFNKYKVVFSYYTKNKLFIFFSKNNILEVLKINCKVKV